MNAYNTIYGTQVSLQNCTADELQTIEFLQHTTIEAIREKTRTQLRLYRHELNDLLQDSFLALPWDDEDDDTKLRKSVFYQILDDLSDRLTIAAGLKNPKGVKDPDVRPKEWTGQLEHSGYLFHVTQEKKKSKKSPLQFFLAHIRFSDDPSSQFWDGLSELHEVRGRELIGAFSATERQEEIDMISALRETHRTDIDGLLLHTFGSAFTLGSKHAKAVSLDTESLTSPIDHDPVVTNIESETGHDVRQLLRNLVFIGVYFGRSGKRRKIF